MTDDRKLLELAAKAAGYDGVRPAKFGCDVWMALAEGEWQPWNPLTDDGDALRLAVKLRLEIGLSIDGCVYAFRRHSEGCHEPLGGSADSANAATRRAIVRAAAALVKD